MLGQLEVVKAFVAASPRSQQIRGAHGISLLAHAKAGGEKAKPVLEFLQSLGDADSEPSIALSDSDAAALAGIYVFGMGGNQQIEVTADKRQGAMAMYSPLTWIRKGGTGRPLVHLGERSFYPAGAPSARIHFAEEKDAIVMTVHDPDLVLTARRNQPAK
jgi:hypothetical protein